MRPAAPTLLYGEYIGASRQAVTQRLRRTRSALVAGMLALLAAGGVALWQLEVAIGRKHTAQSLQLAAVSDATLSKNPELRLAGKPGAQLRERCPRVAVKHPVTGS